MNDGSPTLTPPNPGSGPPEPCWVLRARTSGIDQLLSRASLSVVELVQLAPGRLSSKLFRMAAPGTDLDGGETSLPLRAVGTTSPGKVTVTFVLACPGRCVMDGFDVAPDMALVWRPGVAYDGISPAGYRWATVILPERDVYDLVPSARGTSDGPVPLRSAHVPRPIRTRVATLLRSMRAWEPPGREVLEPGAGAALCREWGELVAWALRTASPVEVRTGALHAATIVADAERALLDRLASDVYLGEVSRHIGVPARTLEAAFRSVLGFPPMRYVELLRAHAVFRELRRSGPGAPGSVREVEARFGVRHPARFAARYRSIFGENPTATLHAARATADGAPPGPEPGG